MSDMYQIPGDLDITVVAGDDLSVALDFSIALTGYTISAAVITSRYGVLPITVETVDLSAGKINLRLSAIDTAKLIESQDWYLKWVVGGVTRTVLEGKIRSYVA